MGIKGFEDIFRAIQKSLDILPQQKIKLLRAQLRFIRSLFLDNPEYTDQLEKENAQSLYIEIEFYLNKLVYLNNFIDSI